jgi:hypothetical protein
MTVVSRIHGGLGESTLGGVIDAKGDREREWEVHCLVCDPVVEVESVGACYIGCGEGGD